MVCTLNSSQVNSVQATDASPTQDCKVSSRSAAYLLPTWMQESSSNPKAARHCHQLSPNLVFSIWSGLLDRFLDGYPIPDQRQETRLRSTAYHPEAWKVSQVPSYRPWTDLIHTLKHPLPTQNLPLARP